MANDPNENVSPVPHPIIIDNADLSQERKETLGGYLSELTRGNATNYDYGRNEQGIEASNNPYPVSYVAGSQEIELYDRISGLPSELTTPNSSQNHYLKEVQNLESEAVNIFNNLSNGGTPGPENISGTFEDVDSIINKNDQVSGHHLLRNLKEENPISSILKHNRFTKDDSGTVRTRFSQSQFGDFQDISARPDGSYNTTSPDEFKRLARIGRSLMLSATGDRKPGTKVEDAEDTVSSNQGFGGFNGIVAKAALGSVTFGDGLGAVPLGTKRIPVEDLHSFNQDKTDEDFSDDDIKFSDYTSESYGQLNSYMEDFSSRAMFDQAIAGMFSSLGMAIQYWLIAEALLLATNGVNMLVSLTGKKTPNDAIFAGPAASTVRLNKGQSRTRQKYQLPEFAIGGAPGITGQVGARVVNLLEDFLDFLEVRKPAFVMQALAEDKSVARALIIPFTQSIAYGWITLVVGQLADLGASSGYYASILRSLQRNRVYLDTYSSSGDQVDLIAYFRKMKENKLMRFVQILSTLGEISVAAGFFGKYLYSENDVPIDLLPDTGVNRVAKHRDFSGKSIVSVSSTPSMMLLPRSLQRAAITMENLGLDNGLHKIGLTPNTANNEFVENFLKNDPVAKKLNGAIRSKLGHPNEATNNRFSEEEVKAMEDMLEAEYMPFYFHDLRTNEIISFNAFLSSLSDGFSAEWSAQKGFGRIEAAQIYGGASRSISFNFILQAMSPADMDEMYYKINKLTTLVYPQYSRGTMMETDSNKFVIPFSQVPTASPLVRIRIGDLFRSNYSDQTLGRMMGAGDPEFVYDGKGGGDLLDNLVTEATVEAVNAWNKELAKNKGILPFFGKADFVAPRGSDAFFGIKGGKMKRRMKLTGYVFITKNGFAEAGDLASRYKGLKPSDLQDGQYWMFINDANTEAGEPSLVKIKQKNITNIDPAGSITAFADVFLPSFGSPGRSFLFDGTDKGNPIIRSFRSSGGRGLACAISGLGIDWKLNSTLWETTPGKRGPTGCEISISCVPIHDITPGLDADGFNRAPVYGIGDINRQLQGDFWMATKDYNEHLKTINGEKAKGDVTPTTKAGIPGKD
mgnify:CR=1 FL=1|tara:strand:+ start:489 stop:3737 length:3249 start_codon:yes stop_codon:yes gene_type:complete